MNVGPDRLVLADVPELEGFILAATQHTFLVDLSKLPDVVLVVIENAEAGTGLEVPETERVVLGAAQQ